MKLLSAFLLSLVLPTRCLGTIIIVEIGRDRIIVAADSREAEIRQATASDDLACKITPLGTQAFFFNTGLADIQLGFSNKVVRAGDLAREVFTELQPVSGDYGLVRMTAQWGERVREAMGHHVSQGNGQIITEAVFASADGQALRAYDLLIVQVVIPGAGNSQIGVSSTNLYDRSNSIALFGMEEVYGFVSEFLANRTPRAIAANKKFTEAFSATGDRDHEPNRLRSAIESAIEWAPASRFIGGPVDVLVLDRTGGIRWVKRKANCEVK